MGQGKGSTRVGKGRFHPSRISGRQKFLRALKANEEAAKDAKRKKRPFEPLDMTKPDWTRRR